MAKVLKSLTNSAAGRRLQRTTRSLLPYLNPKPAQLRGMLLIAAICLLADWAVKKFNWWYSIPHFAERPIWILALFLIACLLLLSVIPTRWMMIGCGLLLGGLFANLIDLQVDGVVWNMIPLLGDTYANLADVAIVSSLVLLLMGLLGRFLKLWQQGYFSAKERA